jgi:hypothetical protein
MKDGSVRLLHSRCALLWAMHNGHTKLCSALQMVSYEVWRLLGMVMSWREQGADEQVQAWGLAEGVLRRGNYSLVEKTADDAEEVVVAQP